MTTDPPSSPPPATLPTPSPTASPLPAHGRRPTILVVDDERSYRVLLDMNLRRAGYRVLLAETGAEGLELLTRESPDLVLLDLRLPDLDGEDVCRRIRSGAAYVAHARVAVIMVTARAEQSQKVRGLLSGADDYVTKPFDMAELLARIQAVLRRSEPGAGDTAGSPGAATPIYHHGT
ncbi:MAG TPA: response regulator, partial [Chloroflexota bacterium]|nr:response regulator [Chloroflexota bacterium]